MMERVNTVDCRIQAECQSLRPRRLLVGHWRFFLLVLAIPLVLRAVWGIGFADSIYGMLQCARDLGTGRAFQQGWDASCRWAIQSPLGTAALAIGASAGFQVPRVAALLTAFGWGAASMCVFAVCHSVGGQRAGYVGAILMSLGPTVVSGVGPDGPWLIVLVCVATTTALWPDRLPLALGLVALTLTHLGLGVVLLAAGLCVLNWWRNRSFPVVAAAVVGIALAGWTVLALRGLTSLPTLVSGFAAVVASRAPAVVYESELYLLFVPFLVLGFVALGRVLAAVGCGLLVILAAVGDSALIPVAAASAACLTAIGVDALVTRVEATGRSGFTTRTASWILTASLVSPLCAAEASSLWVRYQTRPLERGKLEERTADWLRKNSDASAAVLGSARIGFLADRSTLAWVGDATDSARLSQTLQPITERPPEFVVTRNTIGWRQLAASGWLQDSYVPQHTVESAYDSLSPFAVWGYRFAGAAHRPAMANFGNLVTLLSFAVDERVTGSDDIAVRLCWEVLAPPQDDYHVFVHLTDGSGQLIGAHDGPPMNGRFPSRAWQTGDIVPDVHELSVPADLAPGRYGLSVGLYQWPSVERLPVWDAEGVEQQDRVFSLIAIEAQ
jgi:hypothetical protein